MKKVPFIVCSCGKRGFTDERSAEKALGRAQAKRRRNGEKHGTMRGQCTESRMYWCEVGEVYHLTSQSRRYYESYALPEAVAA